MADHDKPADTGPTEQDVPEAGPAEPAEASEAAESADAAEPEPAAPGPSEPDTPEATADGAASTPDSPARVGATIPAWWTWVGNHRKPVAIVAALVVVAVVATVVTVSIVTPTPKDVVQSYLDAIRAGDTAAALDIVGEPDEDDRVHFLDGDALADDWTVTSVVERHVHESQADVDVTITAGNTSGQGRFHLVEGDDGWTIESPFVRVDLLIADVDTIELGDVRQPVRDDTPAGSGTVSLLLFPGVYDLYPSLGDQVTFDPGVLVASPQPSEDTTDRVTATYTLTEEGTAAANEAIAARIRECASTPGLTPAGCPFSAENDVELYRFSDVVDVRWAVTAMPEARFVPTPGGALRTVLRKPGTAKLSGTGVPYEPEGAEPQPFTVTCEFGVGNMAVAPAADGMAVTSAPGSPYAAQDTTHCFRP